MKGYHTRGKQIAVTVLIALLLILVHNCNAWVLSLQGVDRNTFTGTVQNSQRQQYLQPLYHSATNIDKDSLKENTASSSTTKTDTVVNEIPYDYEIPEDAVIHIKPAAMRRLRELRDQQIKESTLKEGEYLTLRMGVRSGGCSGMSYVMDFCSTESINDDDDQIDLYESDRIQCVVDSKSMLYLYGLQLDYSTELIGGGFKFYNPNAEESCGCGSSFGV